MAEEQISFLSYMGGGILSTAMLLVAIYLCRIKVAHFSLIIAAAASALWSFAVATNYHGLGIFDLNLAKPQLLLLEVVRYGAWITALLFCLKFTAGQHLPQRFLWIISGLWILIFFLASGLTLAQHPILENTNTLIWCNLVLSITGLVSVEQLYKNASYMRLIKLWSITIGAFFVYDIYLFSHSLIFNHIDLGLWQARGIINGTAILIMALGSLGLARQSAQRAKFALSRPVAFYTTSLSAAGGFLAMMAVGGYYVQIYGGQWGTIVQVILLFLALMSVAVVFISHTARSHLNVWINKHFFHHKYDYRVEWLRLINALSKPADVKDFQQITLEVVSSIFKSPAAALWLHKGECFASTATLGLSLSNDDLNTMREMPNTRFCQAMQDNEWVFSPYSPGNAETGNLNEHVPEWMSKIPDLWLIMPLLTENELLGFIVLAEPSHDNSLTWEDLDLVKTVGRQVASYLDRHHAAEELAESRQFDAFNKLTAFIMHDLKNLIAQQALVVDNAAKHKDNPAFIEDAIRTIENSVGRMSTLLKKLQQNEPSELRSLNLHKIVMEALKKCQHYAPTPTLRLEDADIKVNADPDRLIMTLTHIIKNAQEATPNGGFIDVTLRRADNNAIIIVEDNGEGMSSEFIRDHLFKPFVTTKSGKGMGIGVYQANEYISSLGGKISVSSSLGHGTTFNVSLPANQE
jgi:putative PEP-CTERM system histidine kinase